MKQPVLEITEAENEEVERYLTHSIMTYGIEQLNGEEPLRAFCSFREHNDDLIGAAMGYKTLNLFFITHLYVEEQHRNNGYANKLLNEIENKARLLGCNILRLNTLNKKTRSLYSKAGFKKTSTIPGYMDGFDLVYYHKNI